MAKFYGPIGYAVAKETSPGVWMDEIIERNYFGDILENTSGWSSDSDSTIDELSINNRISIIADPFAYENFQSMKYVKFMGANWKITKAKVERPRLILTVGGVYNGEQA